MHYELDFLPVGDSNGDAITLRYGDDQAGSSAPSGNAGLEPP
jgi:hypothetical protein